MVVLGKEHWSVSFLKYTTQKLTIKEQRFLVPDLIDWTSILGKILLPIAIDEGNKNLYNLQEFFCFCGFNTKF